MSLHHGTIRKYTAALLKLFNDIEVQYPKSDKSIVTKNVPLRYSAKEKIRFFDDITTEQLISGNTNVLPRGSLALNGLSKNPTRTMNKNNKINTYSGNNVMEYMFNSVPYDIEYELLFQCRGMNEATQLIEQIATKFNPTVNIDVWDVSNLDEPTRIPVLLNDISFDSEEYEELSTNIINLSFSITINGNLYPPIKSTPKVNEFIIKVNKMINSDYGINENILEWDIL